MDERKKEHKVPSVKLLIMDCLKKGPLNSLQLSLRLGHKINYISGVCSKYPEIFERAGKEVGDRRMVTVWKLKNGGTVK